MLNEAQLRAIALFFYFAFQDEKLAEQASTKVISQVKRRLREQEIAEKDMDAIIVAVTQRVWASQRKNIRSTQSSVTYEGGWILPKDADLGAWRQFRKETTEDEFLVIIWSKLLKFTDDAISKGLGVTTGTVRHRVGRGLKLLGTMTERGSNNV